MATALPDSAIPENQDADNGNQRPPSTHSDGARLQLRRKQLLVLRLGASLLRFGSPTYDIGRCLSSVAEALDLGDVEIAIFPNTLLASFTSVDRDRSRPLPPTWPPGHHVHFRDEPDDEAEQLLARRASENRNTIMATFDSRSDLTKLEAVVALSRRVIDGALTVEEAEFLLAEIDHVKRHGFWDVVDAFVAYPTFAAVASIVFFGGNWLSFLLSVPPAVLISLVGHSPLTAPLISRDLSKLVPFIAGFISAFSARMSAYLFRDQCYPTLVLAPIARLLPGTEVLLAFVEIATGDMVTGTSRLGAAAVNILLIAFGTILGSDLAYWVPRRRGRCEPTGNPGFAGVLALLAALAEIVMNRGEGMSVKVWFWITIAAGVGYAVYYLASTTAEYATTAFGGSLVIGMLGNLYSRLNLLSSPSPTIRIGISLIGPGALALRGVSGLFGESGNVNASQLLLAVIEVSVGIFSGLLGSRIAIFGVICAGNRSRP